MTLIGIHHPYLMWNIIFLEIDNNIKLNQKTFESIPNSFASFQTKAYFIQTWKKTKSKANFIDVPILLILINLVILAKPDSIII